VAASFAGKTPDERMRIINKELLGLTEMGAIDSVTEAAAAYATPGSKRTRGGADGPSPGDTSQPKRPNFVPRPNPFAGSSSSPYSDFMKSKRFLGPYRPEAQEEGKIVIERGLNPQYSASSTISNAGGEAGALNPEMARVMGASTSVQIAIEMQTAGAKAYTARRKDIAMMPPVEAIAKADEKVAAVEDPKVREALEAQNALMAAYHGVAKRGVSAVNRRVSELEVAFIEKTRDLERQTRKKCIVFASAKFTPKAGGYYTDCDLLSILTGMTKAMFGVEITIGEITQIHPIGREKIIVAFKSQAYGSAYARLADKRNLAAEVRRIGKKPFPFRLRIIPGATQFDETVVDALKWLMRHNGFMMAGAAERGFDQEKIDKIVPIRRRLIDCGIDAVSCIPWGVVLEGPNLKTDKRKRSFATFESVRRFFGARRFDAYCLGCPPSRWMADEDGTRVEGESADFLRGALARAEASTAFTVPSGQSDIQMSVAPEDEAAVARQIAQTDGAEPTPAKTLAEQMRHDPSIMDYPDSDVEEVEVPSKGEADENEFAGMKRMFNLKKEVLTRQEQEALEREEHEKEVQAAKDTLERLQDEGTMENSENEEAVALAKAIIAGASGVMDRQASSTSQQ